MGFVFLLTFSIAVIILQYLELMKLQLEDKFLATSSKCSYTCWFGNNARVLQKLLKYFNDTAISTYFVLPSSGDFLVVFTVDLNDSELAKV